MSGNYEIMYRLCIYSVLISAWTKFLYLWRLEGMFCSDSSIIQNNERCKNFTVP